MTSKARKPTSPCAECCGHGIALVWFCVWCAEIDEFGTSDFGVWGTESALPCEHSGAEHAVAAAS